MASLRSDIPKGYLTLNALVEFLKVNYPSRAVSYPTMRRYAENGMIKTIRVGGQQRVETAEIARYIECGTIQGGASAPSNRFETEVPILDPQDLINSLTNQSQSEFDNGDEVEAVQAQNDTVEDLPSYLRGYLEKQIEDQIEKQKDPIEGSMPKFLKGDVPDVSNLLKDKDTHDDTPTPNTNDGDDDDDSPSDFG